LKFLNCVIQYPSYVPMTAWLRHGPFAMWLVNAARPRRIVELGTHYGYSYFSFCQAVRNAGLTTECIAVDTWKGDEHAGHYGEEVYRAVLRENEHYNAFSTLLRKTFAEALDDVSDGSIDLLHIDGRHLYGDVKGDFESWLPKLAKNAIVLFHDTVVEERGFGVWKYWNEISQQNETFNFTYQHGLGVLFRGKDLTPEMGHFRAMTQTEIGREALTSLFFAAGDALALDHTMNELAQIAHNDGPSIRAFLDSLADDHTPPEAQFVRLPPGAVASAEALLDLNAAAAASAQALHDAQVSAAAIHAETMVQNEKIDALTLENMSFRRELADARGRAQKVWKEYLIYKLLLKLSTSSILPVSDRARDRWAKSAAKRDPRRTLRDMPALSDGLAEVVAQADMLADASSSRGKVTKGRIAPDPAKPNILLVSHEASWTGAPILVHNLAREFSKRYNVSIVCVKRNVDLLRQLLEVSTDVLVLRDINITGQVSGFVAERDFKFAIVNSVESRKVLPTLKLAGVPTVALMHEFASYTLPKTAFTEAITAADYTVFSTNLTFDSAYETTGLSPTPFVRVLPQGKCDVPSKTEISDVLDKERAKLKARLRPPGTENDYLIIGAGTVQIRKGLDLFIEVARKVLASPQGSMARFVWIGPGYDVETDSAYSVYLQDQLRRAGIEDRVTLLPSTPEIEYAYELADAFMLSSRVDPLPNVCIDAMLIGLPIMCFDRASGFPEILRTGGMAEDCVADYLDPADLARRVIALMASPKRYELVSRRMKEIATDVFDMPRYASQIEELAKEAMALRRNRDEDSEIIANSEGFDPGMLPSKVIVSDRKQAARVYMETFSMGGFDRRPEPGFNQHSYAEHQLKAGNSCAGHDAYAHFLQAGRPAGPWLAPVLDTTGAFPPGLGDGTLRCALHIHAYYVGELPRLLGHLAINHTRPAIFVSVTGDEAKQRAERFLTNYTGASEVRIVPNIGRDIGPFLTEFGRELVENFDVIGHVHTKKSVGLANRRDVDAWNSVLFENVLGGKAGGVMADRIVHAFQADPTLGLVYPSDPNIVGWTKNWQHAQELGKRLNLPDLPQAFDFPVGTMFWMRAEALRPFIELGLDWQDYPREPVGMDATMLHALERLFGIIPLRHGFHAAVTRTPGVTR
jgi:glycosyltransferase involved in cell wall biosynthesis